MNCRTTQCCLLSGISLLLMLPTTTTAFAPAVVQPFRRMNSRLFEASATEAASATKQQLILSWPKPMGIVFEQFGDNEVTVVALQDAALMAEVCIRDTLVAIQNIDCRDWSIDQVLDTIGGLTGEDPVLTFERPTDATVVKFNKSKIAARPGEHLCNLALETETDILYSCRSGGCGTCEQVAVLDGCGKKRYMRPCTAVVPRGCKELLLEPANRLSP